MHAALVAWGLWACLAPLGSAPLKLGVEPFRDAAGGNLGADVQSLLLGELASVRQLVPVEVSPGVPVSWTHALRGDVRREGPQYQLVARCVDVQTNELLPGPNLTQTGADLGLLCRDIASALAARLTRGALVAAEADDVKVRNDNSTVALKVRYNKDLPFQEQGFLPVYVASDLARIRVSANVSGHLLAIGVGANEVYQLYPPVAGASGAIGQDKVLDLPTADYARHGMGTDGFEMVGEQQGVERVHFFFARRPIQRSVPDPRLNPDAELMLPKQYYDQFLPGLRAYLATLDPAWNGTSAPYYYAVTADGIPKDPVPPPTQANSAAENRQAAQDRGSVIVVEEAVGAASLQGTTRDQAISMALLDARRVALESALGVMLQSETKIKDFELLEDKVQLQSRSGYVRIVKQLGDPLEKGGAIIVKIKAEVTTAPLLLTVRDNAEFRELYEEMEHPRIACLIDEEAGGEKRAGGTAEIELVKLLKARGFEVVDATQSKLLQNREKVVQALSGNPEAANWLEAEPDIGAEVIIGGAATAAVARQQAGGTRVQARIELKAVCAADARILWSDTKIDNPLVSTGDDRLSCREGLTKAAAGLGGTGADLGFVDKLVAEWVANPTVFTITLAKAKKADVDRLVALLTPPKVDLQKVDMTKPATYRRGLHAFSGAEMKSFTTATSTVVARSPLRPRRAREFLDQVITKLGWEPTAILGTRYNVTVKAAAPAKPATRGGR